MRDCGNQRTLGVLLGTFGHALIVPRAMRGGEGVALVPALGVTLGIVLATTCVARLIYFIHPVSNRIKGDTVLDLVSDGVVADMERLTLGVPCSLMTPIRWTWPRPLRAVWPWSPGGRPHQAAAGTAKRMTASAIRTPKP